MKHSLFVILFVCMSHAVWAGGDQDKFHLLSLDLKDGQTIPSKYTCVENDINPALDFRNIPAKTKSFAVTMISPDAPEGIWVHWVLYNIDPKSTGIAEAYSQGVPLLNDFGKFSYNGPCPTDNKLHHYVFNVYALDRSLEINEGGTQKDLERSMRGHILSAASITTTFRQSTP